MSSLRILSSSWSNSAEERRRPDLLEGLFGVSLSFKAWEINDAKAELAKGDDNDAGTCLFICGSASWEDASKKLSSVVIADGTPVEASGEGGARFLPALALQYEVSGEGIACLVALQLDARPLLAL